MLGEACFTSAIRLTPGPASAAASDSGVARLIALLSEGMTLQPGDVILTGTPEGVGNARTPPEYLKEGDLVETEIEAIGILRNRVAQSVAALEAAD